MPPPRSLPEVFAAMRPWFTEQFGNASSIHFYGQRARAAVEHAREQVARLLGCRQAEIIFTSGGTESDNLALVGILKPGDHLITSSIEHHAVLHTAERLRDRGVEVTFLPVDADGLIDPADVRRALRPNTQLISIMMANNEIGTLAAVAGDRRDRGGGGCLLPYRCCAGSGQGSHRREDHRLRSADHLRAQVPWSAGDRRVVHPAWHPPRAPVPMADRRSGSGAPARRTCRALLDWDMRPRWRGPLSRAMDRHG